MRGLEVYRNRSPGHPARAEVAAEIAAGVDIDDETA